MRECWAPGTWEVKKKKSRKKQELWGLSKSRAGALLGALESCCRPGTQKRLVGWEKCGAYEQWVGSKPPLGGQEVG